MNTASGVHAAELQALLFPNAAPTRVLHAAKATMAALPLIAQGLVDRIGHKVRLVRTGYPTAMTDGTTIAITEVALPQDNADMQTYLYYVAMKMGLLFHEVGHVNETDFSVLKPRDRLTGYLLNLIEDVRQEVAFCSSVKTGRQHLRALAYAMVDLGLDTPVSDQDDMTSVFCSYLYFRMRAEFAGETVYVPLMQGADQHLRRHFREAFIIKMNGLIGEVPGLQSTADALELAEAFRSLVVDEINDLKRQQKQQQKQQQAGQGGQGTGSTPSPSSCSDANQGGQQDPSSAPGQGTPSTGDASGQDSGNGTDPNASNGAGQGAGSGNDKASGPVDGSGSAGASNDGDANGTSIADAIAAMQELRDGKQLQGNGSRDKRLAQELSQALSDLISTGQYELVDVEPETIAVADDEEALTTSVSAGLDVDLTVAQSVVGPLRARLANRLHADSRTKTGHSRRGSKIDPKRLIHAAKGDPRIFQTYREGVTVDTAVMLLADTSGSMSGPRIAVTDQALFATAAAMETMPGVKVAVMAFPGNQLVLPFGQRVRHAEQRFRLSAGGGTPMAEGVRVATRLLQRRAEPRKLLIVLTDGEPDSVPNTRAALLATQFLGIETLGIGIQTRSVERLFERREVIQEVTQLPEKMLALLSSTIDTYRKSA